MRVRRWLSGASLFLLLAGLQATALASPRDRDDFARGGFGAGGVTRVYRPFPRFYSWGFADPYWGWGWSPWYYGPWGVNVQQVNYGIVEFNVKPKDSRVYVDRKYMGIVSELSGRHHEIDLPRGYHDIRVVAPDGRSAERTVYLALGQKIKFDQHFE